MEQRDLVPFLGSLDDTLSVYTAVDDRNPADAIVAVAIEGSSFDLPSWVDRGDIATAIEEARSMDAAGVAFFARADGQRLVAPMVDPPRHDVVRMASVPHLVPLIENMRRSIDHLVVGSNLDVRDELDEPPFLSFAHFPEEGPASQWEHPMSSGNPFDIADLVVQQSPATTEMILLALPAELNTSVIDRIASEVPPNLVLSALDLAGDLTDQTVRAVADLAASKMVADIRMYRFMDSHDAIAEGFEHVLTSLSAGRPTRLLVGLGADLDAIATVGVDPDAIQWFDADRIEGGASAPAVDAAIRSAVLQGIPVQIFPEHLPDGPAEGIGVILDH